jgi:hypothetical protein
MVLSAARSGAKLMGSPRAPAPTGVLQVRGVGRKGEEAGRTGAIHSAAPPENHVRGVKDDDAYYCPQTGSYGSSGM